MNFAERWNNGDLVDEFLEIINSEGLNSKGLITAFRIKTFANYAQRGFNWVWDRWKPYDYPDILFTLYQDAPMQLSIYTDKKTQISIGVNFLELICKVWDEGGYLTQCKTDPHKLSPTMAIECLAVEEAYHWIQLSMFTKQYKGFLNGTENLGDFYKDHPIERDAEKFAVRVYLKEKYALE